jgi:hypothetical protein
MIKDLPQDEITSVARSIVAEIAPQELMLFRLHSEEFFRNPGRVVATAKPREDAMGFGAGEAVQFVTPWILMALTQVVEVFREEAAKQIGEQAKAGVRGIVQHLFGKTGRGADRLSPSQLQRIHAAALANAGPNRARAEHVANAIVAALSLPPAATPASDRSGS